MRLWNVRKETNHCPSISTDTKINRLFSNANLVVAERCELAGLRRRPASEQALVRGVDLRLRGYPLAFLRVLPVLFAPLVTQPAEQLHPRGRRDLAPGLCVVPCCICVGWMAIKSVGPASGHIGTVVYAVGVKDGVDSRVA